MILCDTLEDLTRKAAHCIAQYLESRARSKQRISLILSGGSTPKTLYQHFSAPPLIDKMPWEQLHLFWGDERCVPPDDPRNNYRLAYDAFVSRVPIPLENIHRMPAEGPDPFQAAVQYETHLRQFFSGSSSNFPEFDLILLGIGADGHTASLFPEEPALKETKRWVVEVVSDKLEIPRLTLTYPVINHASQVIFLAAGFEKAPVLRCLSLASVGSSDFPFLQVKPIYGGVTFFIDETAASQFDSKR